MNLNDTQLAVVERNKKSKRPANDQPHAIVRVRAKTPMLPWWAVLLILFALAALCGGDYWLYVPSY